MIQFLTGILAGAFIALGSAATNTAVYGIEAVWTAKTIAALLFPFGLAMVILMGGSLFTGNCLIAVNVLDRRAGMGAMLQNWVLVYFGNFVGAAATAAGCALFGQMSLSGGQLALYTIKLAVKKSALPFADAFVLGIFCNILVSLGVLMAMVAKEPVGKIIACYLPVCFFVLCGFEHCVANMYYITAGILANTVPAYAQLAVEAGVDTAVLGLGGMVANLIPVTLGNIVGGAGIGIFMWLCHAERTPAKV